MDFSYNSSNVKNSNNISNQAYNVKTNNTLNNKSVNSKASEYNSNKYNNSKLNNNVKMQTPNVNTNINSREYNKINSKNFQYNQTNQVQNNKQYNSSNTNMNGAINNKSQFNQSKINKNNRPNYTNANNGGSKDVHNTADYRKTREHVKEKPSKSSSAKLWTVIIAVIIVIAGKFISYSDSNKHQNSSDSTNSTINKSIDSTNSSADSSSSNNKSAKKCSMDDFMNIKLDSSYNDVIKILGNETRKDLDPDTNSKFYTCTWKNSDYSNIVISFNNNKVTGKSQSGLNRNSYSDISISKFNKLDKEITYENAEAILGKGNIVSEEKYGSNSQYIITYSWHNKDGGSIYLSFKNGKLLNKSKYNLK